MAHRLKTLQGLGPWGWLRDLVTVSGGDADESRVLFGWQFGPLVFDSISQFLTKGARNDNEGVRLDRR